VLKCSKVLFLTVSCDFVPQGINLVGWWSTMPDFLQGGKEYPFYYHYFGDEAEFHIHANCELTIKLAKAIAEHVYESDRLGVKADERRKVVNR
jgi:hypothetical protein